MYSKKPDDALRLIPSRSATLLWALFITFATATQLAFKWAGSELEGQELGLGFIGAALARPSVWTAIAGRQCPDPAAAYFSRGFSGCSVCVGPPLVAWPTP